MIHSVSYPLPRIDTIINNISKFKYFTTLDFPSAYHQISLSGEFRKIYNLLLNGVLAAFLV